MKITIIGTGAYSIGIAKMLAKREKNNIMLWTENEDNVIEFNRHHVLSKIMPNVVLPDNVSITNSYEEALKDAKIIFLITSVKYITSVLNDILPYYKKIPICIASKGIHDITLSTLSTLVKEKLHTNNICVISGPTFAVDLVNDEPTALAIAGFNKKTIDIVKKNLENDSLKLRISSDVIGIELCGSIKNIIAIASGILKGLGYSESTQAFLINESLHDIKHIIHALGGRKKTILSFAGIGDLLLTCFSTKSRNYTFGYIVGSTNDTNKIQEYLKNNTVEGYYTLNSVYKMLKKKRINIPLITTIYNIVVNGKDPHTLATFLIKKP